MSSKQAVGWLFCALLLAMALPRAASAAEWNVSPFRAQIANQQAEDETVAADDTAAPGASLKKNIGKGVLFSLVIPGTGQLYGGSWLRALPWFAVEVASWAMFASYHGQGQDKTEEFEAFSGTRDAPANFDYRAYMWYEWRVAGDAVRNQGRPTTTLSYEQWLNTPWEDREPHLPAPFTHDVLTTDMQQFHEMIGKYLLQFGFGWVDTWSGQWGTDTWALFPDWTQPDPGLRADDSLTVEFDGESPMFFNYRDMRGDANDLLDKGNVFMEVVLVNHILSALDAAFTVRGYNKRVAATAEPSLGDLQFHYNRKLGYDPQTGKDYSVRMLTLSMPLDQARR